MAPPPSPTMHVLTLSALLAAAAAPALPLHQETSAGLWLAGARLHPVAGGPIDDGVLGIEDGRIVAVGARGEVEIPAGAQVRELGGRVIVPGLVCTHSHVGEPWGGDRSGPMQPEVRALDSIDVRAAGLERARAGGLTTLNLMPGSGHLIGGQTVYVKLRRGDAVEELAYRRADGAVAGGLKMANGTNPQGEPPFPGTRARAAALVRQAFLDAKAHGEKRARALAAGDPPPAPDLGKETLLEVLEGTRVVHHHTHRHDDVLTVLRLREELGFRVVLHHVSDAWKVADQLAAARVPCSLILVDSPGGKLEARDLRWESAAELEGRGVPVALHTDDHITDSRLFLRAGALAIRAGMTPQGALRALTLEGARMLDLDERIGSLEVGKDADFALLSGEPFSVYTQVLETWVEGARVFDREDPEQRVFAVGGEGAGWDRAELTCCDR